MAKVLVNEGCLGCGACVGVCPEVFDFNADGLAENILGEEVPEDLVDGCKDAAAACPAQVIVVE